MELRLSRLDGAANRLAKLVNTFLILRLRQFSIRENEPPESFMFDTEGFQIPRDWHDHLMNNRAAHEQSEESVRALAGSDQFEKAGSAAVCNFVGCVHFFSVHFLHLKALELGRLEIGGTAGYFAWKRLFVVIRVVLDRIHVQTEHRPRFQKLCFGFPLDFQ